MATETEYYVSCSLSVLLGVPLSIFALVNLLHDTGALGSFGHKFGYEMDVVMGGMLGVPHYSKVECVMLGFGAAGAFLSASPSHGLITVLGLISGASYMAICGLYAHFAGLFKQEGPGFVAVGSALAALACWRWARFLDPADVPTATVGFALFGALTAVAGVVMMVRAPDRKAINERFAMIMAYCDEHKDFVWLAGRDAPEGFSEADPLAGGSAKPEE